MELNECCGLKLAATFIYTFLPTPLNTFDYNIHNNYKHIPMNLFKLFLAAVLFIFVNVTAEAKVIKANSLAEAIEESNILSGKDSLYLSDFDITAFPDGVKQYSITDQLVLINDLGENGNLLNDNVMFKIALTGALQLIGFDLSEIDSRIINLGKVLGSSEGTIIRTAHFKVGAQVII